MAEESAKEAAPAISGDRPIEDPADDRLGFARFAEGLAKSLLAQTASQGLVVGIHGPWGSGKTTLLNFVLHYLEELTQPSKTDVDEEDETENPNLLVVRFNPWWFTGREDLAVRLLDQFRASLVGEGERTRRIKESLGELSDSLSSSPFGVLQKVGFFGRQVFKRNEDVVKLKKKIADVLVEDGRLVVFVVDDIDRLNAEELRHLFGVMKAIGDFPRTLYLVAFDRRIVAAALSDMPGVAGADYLEKIVQIPFELPLPDPSSIRQLLFERLNAILADTPDGLFDEGRWAEVFWSGIDKYIQTPRDIDQLASAISLTYPSVVNEVNAPDFFGIECLRVHAPDAFAVVRRNGNQFAGVNQSPEFGKPDPVRIFHDSWLNGLGVEDSERAKEMLKALFPKFNAAFGGPNPGQGLESRWRTELRVCSEERFPVYFQLAPPIGVAPGSQVRAALALAERDVAELNQFLLNLPLLQPSASKSAARPLLETLVDHADVGLPDPTAKGLLRSLFDVGDQLLASEPRHVGITEFEIDVLIGRIMYRVLRRMSEEERYSLLKELVSNGNALAIIVHEVGVLGQSLGKYGISPSLPSDQLITPPQLEDLEEHAMGRIREAAANGSLATAPDLAMILYRWRDWASEAEVREWIAELTTEDEGLFLLLDAFQGEVTIHAAESPRVIKHIYLDPQELEPFIDPESIAARVETLLEGPVDEDKRLLLGRFLQGLEARRAGKSPRDSYREGL